MTDEEKKWLEIFRQINGLDGTPHVLNKSWILPPNTLNQPRKGPRRLDNILKFDRLSLIVTNRRARAGLKPTKFSR